MKDSKLKVTTLAIECAPPTHGEDRRDFLFDSDYGWFTEQVSLNEVYEIVLPKLDRSGSYEYQVNVHMSTPINSIGKIMTTGKVLDEGLFILSLIWLLLGAILGGLIQRFIID
ncbi:MAG: hypothetical protein V1737_01750 [Chloroflexota bacterium]